MKIAALLEKLAKKAGIDVTTPEYKAIVFPDVDVPEEYVTSLDTKLFTEQAALANSKIRSTIKAESLNGIDSLINSFIEEDQLQDTDSIKTADNSYARVKAFYNHVKKAYDQKIKDATKPGGKDVNKDAYDKQIADLQKELRDAKEQMTKKETEFKTVREGDLTNFEIQSLLSGKDYSLPKEMATKLKITTAKSAIDEALQAKGYKISRSESGMLIVVDKDGKPAYNDSHEAIELHNFFDGVLAQNKLLKVNDQSPDDDAGKSSTTTIPGNGTNVQQKLPANYQQGLSAIESMIAEQTKQPA